MVVSQNGWSANDRSVVSSREVPDTNVRLTVRDGAAGTVLIYVAEQFHKRVEPISNARSGLDDWGYAERPIRGGTSLSNHASGTAIDLNATEHPLGAEGTFTPRQVTEIVAILEEVKHTVRWGGHYRNRKDEMHFEIDKGFTSVALAASELPSRSTGERMFVQHGDTGEAVKYIQILLLRAGEKLPQYGADKDYGDETRDAVASFWKNTTGKDYHGEKVTAWVLFHLHKEVFGSGEGLNEDGDFVTQDEFVNHRHDEGRTGKPN